MCEKNKKPLEAAELTDDQLEQAAGGSNESTRCAYCLQELGTNESCDYCKMYNNKSKAMWKCDKCGLVLHERRSDGWYCTVCGSKDRRGVVMVG